MIGWQSNPSGPPLSEERAEELALAKDRAIEDEEAALWIGPADELIDEIEQQPKSVLGDIDGAALAEQVRRAVELIAIAKHRIEEKNAMTEEQTTIGSNLIGRYCIVRTYSAGVFAGILAARNGKEALIKSARRIWYWSGAASLSQLAVDGTSDPAGCKFPAPVSEVLLTEVIEIIPCTEAAIASIAEVPVWRK